MRKRIWVPGAIALAVLTAASIVTAGQTNNETTGVVRVERTFTSDWHYGCHQDACTGGPLAFPAISVVTPPAEATVDAVITVTMDYQTSLGDYGIVEMRLKPPGTPEVTMRPGRFRLNSKGVLTTTTVSWVRRDVPAAGADLAFRMLALPRLGSGGPDDLHFHFRGHRFTVVIELWSAG